MIRKGEYLLGIRRGFSELVIDQPYDKQSFVCFLKAFLQKTNARFN